jgi:exopolyphosphatase/guanosine-5'-triphosphate,3'-diphosphate pyrophosphatase
VRASAPDEPSVAGEDDLPQHSPPGARARRVAAVDCGTNSLRLLIAERGPDGELVDVLRRLEIVRLGQGVDATGELHPDALRRTFAATETYAELIRAAGVPTGGIRFVATSAARDVRNRTDFFDGVQARLGVLPDVISGDTEARLSFVGALSRLEVAEGPVLVLDIGGGSTELVTGDPDGGIRAAVSLEIGSVRLTERFLAASPPRPADLQRASAYVDDQLTQSGIDLSAVQTWIGVAGTVTTLSAVQLGLETYDRERVHGSVLSRTELEQLLLRLGALSVEEIRAIPGMHPQRADVITAGALIAARVAQHVPVARLVVSESDILDGIALELLASTTGRP